MVKAHQNLEPLADGRVDVERWLAVIEQTGVCVDSNRLRDACACLQAAESERPSLEALQGQAYDSVRFGLDLAQLVADLRLDEDAVVAAVLYRAVRRQQLQLETVRARFGGVVAQLIEGVQRMAVISSDRAATDRALFGNSQDQVKNVRALLVALVDDVRVALIKLSERTCALRAARDLPPEKQRRVAQEIFDYYSPLAHRLGIGHLKWELEDLAFRYLQPESYKQIARLLDERRQDREKYLQSVREQLDAGLRESGVEGEVQGRVKHIYSIWRKMRNKNLDFSQIYDVRALRILVPTLRDCYTALGVVHSLWTHIPREFDDYIANPKENGYRSLHTAVIGPAGKILEVQIRTSGMHEEAEFGVCAHWAYKDPSAAKLSRDYEARTEWLRRALEWYEETGGAGNLGDELRNAHQQERLYVFTPEGHVMSLPAGATPVDFAYHVHTEVGHSCRGAKVNGRIVSLSTPLRTGDRVEILRASSASPSRDWLNPDVGYLQTARARAKVQQWFRAQDREQHIGAGRLIVERELRRLSAQHLAHETLATEMHLAGADELYAAVGAGAVKPSQLLNAIQRIEHQQVAESRQMSFLPGSSARRREEAGDVRILGVGNLLTHLSNCCQPLPGDSVVGYITRGRGVSVHRADCSNLIQLEDSEPRRIVAVEWGEQPADNYPVDILIEAIDREGLLRDVSTVLARESINVVSVNTQSHRQTHTANMKLTIEVPSFETLGRALAAISQLPNVIDARRSPAP
ncbi:MAG: GTP diphosphokinase [Pseudomonadota bacterium]|nr:GTP diphosphokinase [Pseudomonadota bacterium]